MTKDLEQTLDELGPGYRAVVKRLTDAYPPPVARSSGRRLFGSRHAAAYLAAASLLVCVGLCIVFGVSRRTGAQPSTVPTRVYTVRATTAENEYRLALIRDDAAVQEMIRTQNPDGSWQNDFLTRRNAEALKDCKSPAAQIAYKKAIRNLRARGVL